MHTPWFYGVEKELIKFNYEKESLTLSDKNVIQMNIEKLNIS